MTQTNDFKGAKEIYQRLDGKNMIAIASGKGGVGKTFLAIALAQSFADKGQRVLLFDGDLGPANIDIQLGLLVKDDLGSVVSGNNSLNQIIYNYDKINTYFKT